MVHTIASALSLSYIAMVLVMIISSVVRVLFFRHLDKNEYALNASLAHQVLTGALSILMVSMIIHTSYVVIPIKQVDAIKQEIERKKIKEVTNNNPTLYA